MHAFVDESIRQGANDGLYVVAAAVVGPEDLEDDARRAARAVVRPRQRRFHWRNEGEAQRLAMLGALCSLGVTVRAYEAEVSARRLVRARALCIERLLWDLRELEVDRLVFETRQERNDAKDRRAILRAQKAQVAPKDLGYAFQAAEAEPLLWLADAAAGAVAAALSGQTDAYVKVLAGALTVVAVGRV